MCTCVCVYVFVYTHLHLSSYAEAKGGPRASCPISLPYFVETESPTKSASPTDPPGSSALCAGIMGWCRPGFYVWLLCMHGDSKVGPCIYAASILIHQAISTALKSFSNEEIRAHP